MVKLTDYNLKIKDNIIFYSLYFEDNKIDVYGKQGWLNNKQIFQIEETKEEIIFLELNDQGIYQKTSYPWVKTGWNTYWIKISLDHLELLRRLMVSDEQKKIKEKELKKERNKEERKKIAEYNRKMDWVIVNIKDDKRLVAAYTFNGKKYLKENKLGELAVKNKKTGEVIARKRAFINDNSIWVKLHNKILSEWKKEGVINKVVSRKDFDRLLNRAEIRVKNIEINV